MASVTGSVSAVASFTRTDTLTTGATDQQKAVLPANSAPMEFTSGTGISQVNKLWVRTVSLSASTPVTLDLTALTGGVGDTSFAAIKSITFINHETAGGGKDVTVGAAASTPFTGPLGGTTPTIDVQAGTSLPWVNPEAAGWACGTNKNLKLDPGANAITLSLVIAGI